jgi:hypothetical protein
MLVMISCIATRARLSWVIKIEQITRKGGMYVHRQNQGRTGYPTNTTRYALEARESLDSTKRTRSG